MDGGATARRETESRALTLLPPARLLPPAPIARLRSKKIGSNRAV
jgi:hypothetical protein